MNVYWAPWAEDWLANAARRRRMEREHVEHDARKATQRAKSRRKEMAPLVDKMPFRPLGKHQQRETHV